MNRIINIVFINILLLSSWSSGYCQTDANIPYRGITIYISYPDAPPAVTPAQLDSIINGVNYQEVGIQRTFRKYWHEQTRRLPQSPAPDEDRRKIQAARVHIC